METGPNSVQNLEIWDEAVDVVRSVYTLTKTWPKEEMYALTSQVRRAAVSVPANIAEGVGRASSKEVAHFSRIALGSLYELDTLLYLAADFGYSAQDMIAGLRERLTTLAKRISAFITYQENRR